MLRDILIRNFRCIGELRLEPAASATVLCGRNAQGKSSILEAICVLLRLNSPRVTQLAACISHGAPGFVLDGHFADHHLQFYFGKTRRKLALDSLPQTKAGEFLGIGQVVWFANGDRALIDGPAELRRTFMNFSASQSVPGYHDALRSYTRALRSRNHLLRAKPYSRSRVTAYDPILSEQGGRVSAGRAGLIEALSPKFQHFLREISGQSDSGELRYDPVSSEALTERLRCSLTDDERLGTTTTGPHRDDLHLLLGGHPATIGSEGQWRTAALALKLALAEVLESIHGSPPILLLDDIFGELDADRRAQLAAALPPGAQRIATTTNAEWAKQAGADLYEINSGRLAKVIRNTS